MILQIQNCKDNTNNKITIIWYFCESGIPSSGEYLFYYQNLFIPNT